MSGAATNYVALSRHKENVRLFVSKENTPDRDSLVAQLRSGQDKTAARSYMIDPADLPRVQAPKLQPDQAVARAPARRDEVEPTSFDEALREMFASDEPARVPERSRGRRLSLVPW
jgi:hypothetical protein